MDPSFAVLDRAGIDGKDTVGREGWTAIKCASKRACGCGKSGNTAVQDLDLLLYHGDVQNHLSSSLSVRAGDKVFRWIDEEIAEKGGVRPIQRQKVRYFSSKVEIVDKGLIVLTLSFSEYGGFDYYLVFDSVEGSLSIIPHIAHRLSSYTRRPLPVRHEDGGYSLVLFGSESGFGRKGRINFLWLCSPESRVSSPDPWQTKQLRFPTEMKDKLLLFTPDVLFSGNDLAYWTDLALGTLCCDCSALIRRDYVVNFTFIQLPPGYQLVRDEETWSVKVYRTMGCVGGSIKFVAIDKPDKPSDRPRTRVKVWTLELSCLEWKLCSDLRLKSLWKDLKVAGLPESLPMWPMLRELEGSTLYFILAEQTQARDGGRKHYICRLDMTTKSLLQSNLLTHMSLLQGPVIMPSGFFNYLGPQLPSRLDHIYMEG